MSEKASKEFVAISPTVLRAWAASQTDRRTGKTQKSFAQELGVTQSTVSKWVNYTEDFLRMDSVKAIAKYRNESLLKTISFLQKDMGTTDKAPVVTQNADRTDQLTELIETVNTQGQLIGDMLVALRILGEDVKRLKAQSRQTENAISNDPPKLGVLRNS